MRGVKGKIFGAQTKKFLTKFQDALRLPEKNKFMPIPDCGDVIKFMFDITGWPGVNANGCFRRRLDYIGMGVCESHPGG